MHLLGVLWLTPDRGSDFRAFYLSGNAWWQGLPPYAADLNDQIPNLAPPFLLPVFATFAALPFAVALTLWTAISLGLVAWSARAIGHELEIRPWEVALLALGTAPAGIALVLGQVGSGLLACATAGWLALRRGRWTAGVWFGLLCVLKPFYGLLGLWLLRRRDWKAVGAMIGIGGTAALLSVAVAGGPTCLAWIAALRQRQWVSNLFNAGSLGLATRLFATPAERGVLWTPLLISPALQTATVLLLSGAVLVALARVLRRRDLDASVAALMTAGLLLAPLAWVHYLPAALGPLLAVNSSRRAGLWLACSPYLLLLNHHYGPMGTLLLGSWAWLTTATCLSMCLSTGANSARNADATGEIERHETAALS